MPSQSPASLRPPGSARARLARTVIAITPGALQRMFRDERLTRVAPRWLGFSAVLCWLMVSLVPGDILPSLRRLLATESPALTICVWAVTASSLGAAVLAVPLSESRPPLARRLATLGLCLASLLLGTASIDRPVSLFFVMVGFIGGLTALWEWIRLEVPDRREAHPPPSNLMMEGVVLGTLGAWLVGLELDFSSISERIGLTAALLSASWLEVRCRRQSACRLRLHGIEWLARPAALLVLVPDIPLILGAVPFLFLLGTSTWQQRRVGIRSSVLEAREQDLLDVLLADPALTLPTTFFVTGMAGALLLSLPLMSEQADGPAVVDAIFMSFSALCVTGLATLDTPSAFNFLGEFTLLLLIQVGGLGIMTFSTAVLAALGHRLSLQHEATAVSLLGSRNRARMGTTLRQIFLVTFVSEGVGAALLTGSFLIEGDGLATALWRGLFTSISAFCNAGFALQRDSLISYAREQHILLVVAALITLGGLGPVVVLETLGHRHRGRLSLQTRLVLVTSAALTLVGTVLIAAFEWTGTLADLSFTDRLTNALFQAVTLRTAGFNSIDLTAIQPATYTIMIVWMFVGGSPGSTAGGMKTTTLALLVTLLRGAFQGGERTVAFGYEILPLTTHRAAAVSFLGIASVLGTLIMLQQTQVMPLELALFETVSALATVGLTIGGTAALDEVGKVIITLAMFAGRVGPLTLLMVLAQRESSLQQARYPTTEIDVG